MLHSVALAVVPLLLAPVYDGVERKLRALIHTRIGPPVMQTWYDIVKLFSKEAVIPEGGSWCVPVVLSELLLLASAFVVLTHVSFEASTFEVVMLVVLLSTAGMMVVLRSVTQNNVFAVVGGFREFSLMLSAEPFLVSSLLLAALRVGTLASRSVAAAVTAVAAYVVSGRVPYDIAEAEPELSSGVNIELSGPLLGAAVVSLTLKKLISAALTSLVLVNTVGLSGWPSALAVLLATPVVWMAHTVLSVLLGRSRVDLAVRFLYSTLFFLSAIMVVSYWLGL